MVKITPVHKPGEKLEKDGHLGRCLYRKKNWQNIWWEWTYWKETFSLLQNGNDLAKYLENLANHNNKNGND